MAGDELGVRMSNDNKKHRDRSLEIGNRGDGKGSGTRDVKRIMSKGWVNVQVS